jgi:hypothetical protein
MITRFTLFKLSLLSLTQAAPTTNVGEVIRSQVANKHASFEITAEKLDGSDFVFDVVKASNPALNPDTILKNNGAESTVGQGILHTLFVGDVISSPDTFALLALDPQDNLHGIVDAKGSKPYKIHAANGGKVKAVEETNLNAPDWSCGSDHVDSEGHLFDRRLEEGVDMFGHDNEVRLVFICMINSTHLAVLTAFTIHSTIIMITTTTIMITTTITTMIITLNPP